MNIYNYNKDTKEFTSANVAKQNPLEEGKFLMPAHATEIEVIPEQSGHTRCFNENLNQWEYVPDNRGKKVYSVDDKSEHVVDYLGDIHTGFTELIPGEYDKWTVDKWVLDQDAYNLGQTTIMKRAVQRHLDDEAILRGYDNIHSIGKYIGYDNAFRIECEALGAWTANVWLYCYQVLADVEAGTRTEPTIAELIAELPVYTPIV